MSDGKNKGVQHKTSVGGQEMCIRDRARMNRQRRGGSMPPLYFISAKRRAPISGADASDVDLGA